MYKIDGIKVPIGEELTKTRIARCVKIQPGRIKSFEIIKKAIDARKKKDVHYVYSVLAEIDGKADGLVPFVREKYTFPKGRCMKKRPLVVGFGPGGMFAALMLARGGYAPIVVERGADIDTRRKLTEEYWKNGKLDTRTNVQFGEGGAGTFSDGKLNSGIHDKRCAFVLETFAEFGAPKEITYIAKPHIGTDVLAGVVKNIRADIEKNGGEVRFMHKLDDICVKDGTVCGAVIESTEGRYTIDTDAVILAIGHSARDTYKMIKALGADMEQKNFSVGVRIEHRQDMINRSQYGEFADRLGAADYKLSAHFPNGRSAYTFCMCPGGMVVASASEADGIVTNGMSNFARDGKNANSALLVNVTTEDFSSDDPLAGVEFQRKIEQKAYTAAGESGCAPCMYVGDLLGKPSENKVEPTYRPGVVFCDFTEIFPQFVADTIKEALPQFDKKLKGFADGGAVMTAPETRSSAPCRIVRAKDSLMSNINGLYPCGEGAGYAGGIMSAAVDGIKVAEAAACHGLEDVSSKGGI